MRLRMQMSSNSNYGDYKEIRRRVEPHIDKKEAFELGRSLIEGFKIYMKSDQAPETVPNGVAAKGIAHAAAFTLAMCANRHGKFVSDNMKVTFLAYFDWMYDHYTKKMIAEGDTQDLKP